MDKIETKIKDNFRVTIINRGFFNEEEEEATTEASTGAIITTGIN